VTFAKKHSRSALSAAFRFPILAAVLQLLTACSGGANTQSTPPPNQTLPTASLSATQPAVSSGGATTLNWNSTNASSCTGSGGWTGTKSTSGSQSTGALTAGTTFSLTCSGSGGSSLPSSVTVNVVPAATVTLSASPTSVAGGGASALTWSSANATSCAASGDWSGTKATSGTQTTSVLAVTAVYSLTCTGAGGSSQPATAVVIVSGPATATLTASPISVASSGASTLTWRSTGASSCNATDGWSGTKLPSGTQSTGPLTLSTKYSLVCTGSGGTSSIASVTVNVAPSGTLIATPPVVTNGGSAVLSWSSTNATACTATGGWTGSKPGSGTFSTGPLTATTSYTLTCAGTGGTSGPSSATVTVSNGAVGLSPPIAAIALLQSQQFAATVPGGGLANWAVDGIPGGNSTVGTVTGAGLYTAVGGTVAGTHTVVATSVANSSQTGAAVVAVTDLAGVYSYHNDLARDGANLREFGLTTASVNTTSFGKLFSCTADGAIYGQPLWVANLTVKGARHNVVFVATQHDSLFAYDADASPCVTLWSAILIDAGHGGLAGETTVPSGIAGALVGNGGGDIAPEVGVTGTPVIDPATSTLYVVSKSVNSAQTIFYQRLHAIDLATGNEKSGSPVAIAGTYPGTGDGTATVTFNPQLENQRCGLALVNGTVYIAWASHEDATPYYGWVMGYSYDGTAFTQASVLNVGPNAGQSGIWMSGGAIAADSNNNLYAITGNGGFDVTNPGAPNNDYGDSLLQLSSSLAILNYFTPSDQLTNNQMDLDFGAGGAAVLADLPAGSPVQHLIMGGGKDGALYVLNRDNLGGLGDIAAIQRIPTPNEIYATGAYWNNNFYLAGSGGVLNDYLLNPAGPQFALNSNSTTIFGTGATPSVSADGAQSGIVWALDAGNFCTPASPGCGPAVLHAYDATNVAVELWNSSTVGTDAAGNAVKFTVPTIANGKVYVGTRGNNAGGAYGSTSVSGELDVYGLKP